MWPVTCNGTIVMNAYCRSLVRSLRKMTKPIAEVALSVKGNGGDFNSSLLRMKAALGS